jgi:16S rRNA (cytosine1402-N4)-methyltransferase
MTPLTLHIPVLLNEVLEGLALPSGASCIDGTLGGGGHAAALAQCVGPRGQVIALDLDAVAVARASAALQGLPVVLRQGSYAEAPAVLHELGVDQVAGILLDLGLSSDQLADAERGFSFQEDGPLDLRFDVERGRPASALVATLPERDLADLIYRYGEERFSRRIARKIVAVRHRTPVRTSGQLAALVRSCVPRGKHHAIDPATRTFQALRIAVNGELDALEAALARLPDSLAPGGRFAIISFHSLEDRLVKHAFRGDARLEPLHRRPVVASPEEVAANPRARSAKLRVACRVSDAPDVRP